MPKVKRKTDKPGTNAGPYARDQPGTPEPTTYPPRPASLYSMKVGVDGASIGEVERANIAAMIALAEAERARSRGPRSTLLPKRPSLSPSEIVLTPALYAEMTAEGGSLPSGVTIVTANFEGARPSAVVGMANGRVYGTSFDFGRHCGINLVDIAREITEVVSGLERGLRVCICFTVDDEAAATANKGTVERLRTLLAALAETRPSIDVDIVTAEHRVLRAFSEEEGELDAHRELYDEFVSRLRVAAE